MNKPTVNMNEKTIDLSQLKNLCKLTPVRCANFSEAAAVCLENSGHKPGVEIEVEGEAKNSFILQWKELEKNTFLSWQNLEEAVEYGACAFAIFTIFNNTPYEIIEQSVKGGGFDFLLAQKTASTFEKPVALLEVSGIFKGSRGRINARLREKTEQSGKSSDLGYPIFVMVAEFSRPLIKMISHGTK